VIYIVDILEIHGDPFDSVGYLNGYGREIDASGLLKIGKLRDFHTVEPHFPSQTPGSECGRFPVIFDKTYIMIGCINTKTFQTIDVDILDIFRRGFHDNLKLIIVLKSVWIFTIASVCRSP